MNKLIFFSDHGKNNSLFVWFPKMYWPLWRVQLKSFLCVARLKTSHSSLSARSHSHHVFNFVTRVWYTYSVLCGSWFNPCWLCPHILRHRHTYWASAFLSVISTKPATPPLDTACVVCVPRQGLVFYITYDIQLDLPVSPVSASDCCIDSGQLPCLLSPSPL